MNPVASAKQMTYFSASAGSGDAGERPAAAFIQGPLGAQYRNWQLRAGREDSGEVTFAFKELAP